MKVTREMRLHAIETERNDLLDSLDDMTEKEWCAQADRVHTKIDKLDEQEAIVRAFWDQA